MSRACASAVVGTAALLLTLAASAAAQVTVQPGGSAPPATSAPGASAIPRVPPPADLPRDRPLRAGFLLRNGVYGADLVSAWDVLQHSTPHAPPGIEVVGISADGGKITTVEGLAIEARYSLANAPALDILVVPSGAHSMDSDLGDEALMAWLTKAGKAARYVFSLSDGAFLLAKSGLLAGRLATTFPADQDQFARMFPKQELRRGVSFVHDGPALTSIGGARGYDAALYLVDHLFGEEVAKKVAQSMILPWPPGSDETTWPALVIRYREEKKK